MLAADLAVGRDQFLLPGDDIRVVMDRFGHAQAEVLPVVTSREAPRIQGALSEAYYLKRYSEALERRRCDDLGVAV